MITFLKTLNELMTSAISEAYLITNPSKKIKYPYATYSYESSEIERFSDEFTIDVDVFDDQGKTQARIEQTCHEIKQKLHYKEMLADEFLIRVFYVRHNPIPTGSDTLQRRNMQFQIKVDWRI